MADTPINASKPVGSPPVLPPDHTPQPATVPDDASGEDPRIWPLVDSPINVQPDGPSDARSQTTDYRYGPDYYEVFRRVPTAEHAREMLAGRNDTLSAQADGTSTSLSWGGLDHGSNWPPYVGGAVMGAIAGPSLAFGSLVGLTFASDRALRSYATHLGRWRVGVAAAGLALGVGAGIGAAHLIQVRDHSGTPPAAPTASVTIDPTGGTEPFDVPEDIRSLVNTPVYAGDLGNPYFPITPLGNLAGYDTAREAFDDAPGGTVAILKSATTGRHYLFLMDNRPWHQPMEDPERPNNSRIRQLDAVTPDDSQRLRLDPALVAIGKPGAWFAEIEPDPATSSATDTLEIWTDGAIREADQITVTGEHTYVLKDDFAKAGAMPQDTEDAINLSLTITGTEFAVILVEQQTGGFKTSFRSRCALDCSKVAEHFGGGGHKAAAGAFIEGAFESARPKVLDHVRSQLR